MTYGPVILACERESEGERGVVHVALCFSVIRAWLK